MILLGRDPTMARDLRKVSLDSGVDIAEVAEEVNADKEPRVLERNGKPVAALVSMEDLSRLNMGDPSGAILSKPTPEGIRRALKAAGALSEEEGEALQERVYRQRHESPPSRSVKW
jgi:PHD/YefM family antitoxin component YafN of YafNO toxin-antitoxin module